MALHDEDGGLGTYIAGLSTRQGDAVQNAATVSEGLRHLSTVCAALLERVARFRFGDRVCLESTGQLATVRAVTFDPKHLVVIYRLEFDGSPAEELATEHDVVGVATEG